MALVNEIEPEFPKVFGDENRIRQILFNLVGNAVKFTKKGEIIIRASEQESFAKITVTDTGIGIPIDQIEKIFQSFEQVSGQKNENTGGTGLGLSIAKELVELHHGTIGVTSRENEGSQFWFTLPLWADDLPAAPEPEDTLDLDLPGMFPTPAVPVILSRDNGKPKKDDNRPIIMAVDDDPVNLQVIINHLDPGAYRPLAFLGAQAALEALDALDKGGTLPDLILLDVMMPGMNGYEFCRELRKKQSSSQLPVIMLTAKDRISDLVAGFGAGANDYLSKPFFKDELLARIGIQLQLKAAYKTAKENLELKKELDIRERRGIRMRLVQLRLSGMLNRIKAPVLAVSPAREIWFSNQAFETLTGRSSTSLLNTRLTALLSEKAKAPIEACIKKAEQGCFKTDSAKRS